ncbi:hypothetical protein TSUD_30130 [Trifolium subterraneum]|uniref:Reverse transcriptase domain-containing protein n=1 Tax=Trifolium subterraneum TaxID=3900 RepID=A0A2Z6NY57_TRISU|nr:hypothetical protein TSUD_30130 [Trifolium subterraneum]
MAEVNFESLNRDEEEELNFVVVEDTDEQHDLNLCLEEELNFVVVEDTDEQHDLNLCLVGRFVHDRPIQFNSMKACLADVWRPMKGMTVKEATQGLYLFKLFHPMDVEEVLKGGPWTFDNFTLIIDRLKIGVALQDIPLFHVNFWVQIHDVPIGMMLEIVVKGLANYIGEFVKYDKNNNTSFWRKYMRVKVRVDVRSPLKIEKKIKMNGAMERDDGRRSWSNEIRAEVRRPGGRVGLRWLHEEGRNRDDVDASGNSGERGSHQTGPTQKLMWHSHARVVEDLRMGSSIKAPAVSLISNRPILAITNDNTTTTQLTETPSLNESNQFDHDDMDTQVERKRRRNEGLVAAGSEVRTHQHFLLAAIDVEGRSRGLTVFWKDSSKCRVLNYTHNFINMIVEDEQWGEWRLTCYYGYPERSRRRAAWDLLRNLGNMSSIPWCIIGDFNDLLSQADKKGTSIYLDKDQGTPHVIEKRLDRAMASTSWLQLFPHVRTKINHSFRFENSWLKEPHLEDVVVEGWGGRENLEVVDRVTRCANKLQRAKMHWLQEGDMNTRFFHMSATARSKKKKVTKLIADNGTEAHTQEELCEVANSYFDTLFKPIDGDHDPVLNLIQPRVTVDDNFFLTAPITKVEIQQALFQMHPDKSPGPDGFNPAFYQRFWEQCSDDIFRAASTWLERVYFPTSLNETNICLIPKCDNPTSMKDLRPISLCNVLYKMISKVLANRLKCCLDKCVSQEQLAFVEGRSILDNALIATEAYDKVDWGFLRGVMTKMGFTDVWIRWVMMYVSSVNYSVLMNYDRVGPISQVVGRGDIHGVRICHGAPEVVGRGDIHGVRICHGAPEVSHLLFADDCFLFCRANVAEVNDLMRILHIYEQASGGGLEVGIIFVLCMTRGCVGVLIDGCPHLNQQVDVAERILATPLVSSVCGDKVVWEEERNGCYSVKSGYKLAMRYIIGRDKYHVEGNWNGIWKAQAPHKARHLLWRLCKGCLPTRCRLWERRVESTLNCLVCDEEIEDELHIFFKCGVARDIWCAAGLSSVLHNVAY